MRCSWLVPTVVLAACSPGSSESIEQLPSPVVIMSYDPTFEVLNVYLLSDESGDTASTCFYPAKDIEVDVDGQPLELVVEGGWEVVEGVGYCTSSWYQREKIPPGEEDSNVVTFTDGAETMRVQVANLLAERTARVSGPVEDVLESNTVAQVRWSPNTDTIVEVRQAWLWDQNARATVMLPVPSVDELTFSVEIPEIPFSITSLTISADVAYEVTTCEASRCEVVQTVNVEAPVTVVEPL